jgi:hypothetical protein
MNLSGSTQLRCNHGKAAQTLPVQRLVDSEHDTAHRMSSSTLRVASIATQFDEHGRLLSARLTC